MYQKYDEFEIFQALLTSSKLKLIENLFFSDLCFRLEL